MSNISEVAKYSVCDLNSDFFTSKDKNGEPIMNYETALERRNELIKIDSSKIYLIRQNKTWQSYQKIKRKKLKK